GLAPGPGRVLRDGRGRPAPDARLRHRPRGRRGVSDLVDGRRLAPAPRHVHPRVTRRRRLTTRAPPDQEGPMGTDVAGTGLPWVDAIAASFPRRAFVAFHLEDL